MGSAGSVKGSEVCAPYQPKALAKSGGPSQVESRKAELQARLSKLENIETCWDKNGKELRGEMRALRGEIARLNAPKVSQVVGSSPVAVNPPASSTKIYVGGLPELATEQQLKDLFAAHGAVASALIVTDKFTGKSRGFGFVVMSTVDQARAAVTALNDSEMGGHQLTVHDAAPAAATGQGEVGRSKVNRW